MASRKGITPIIAIILLLMMTVAAAGMAYVWVTGVQKDIQGKVSGNINAKTEQMSGEVTIDAVYGNGVAGTVIVALRNTGTVAFSTPINVYVGNNASCTTSVNNPGDSATASCSAAGIAVAKGLLIRAVPPKGNQVSITCDCRPQQANGLCDMTKLDNYCAI